MSKRQDKLDDMLISLHEEMQQVKENVKENPEYPEHTQGMFIQGVVR